MNEATKQQTSVPMSDVSTLPRLHRLLLLMEAMAVPSASRMLLLWVNEMAGPSGTCEFPQTEEIARLLGISRVSAWRAADQLRELGLLDFTKIGRQGKRDRFTVRMQLPNTAPQDQTLAYHVLFNVNAVPGQVAPVQTAPVVTAQPEPPSQPATGTVEQSPVTPPAPVEKPVEAKPAKKKSVLSEEDKAKIVSNSMMMRRWLLWGKEGITVENPDQAGLKPTNTNFMRHVEYETVNGQTWVKDPHPEMWDLSQFMGYFWCRVSAFNQNHNIPVALPNWGRLSRAITDLAATMTKVQLYSRLKALCDHWDVIRFRCRGLSGVQLNETALQHQVVTNTLSEIMQMGPNELAALKQQAANEQGTQQQ